MKYSILKRCKLITYNLSLIMILSLSCYSCSEQEYGNSKSADIKTQKEKLVLKKVKERVTVYVNTKKNKCREDALSKAEAFVHETMINEFKSLFKDTLVFPEKPIKPPMPENLYLDTIGVNSIKGF